LPSTINFTRVICGTFTANVSIMEAMVSDSTKHAGAVLIGEVAVDVHHRKIPIYDVDHP